MKIIPLGQDAYYERLNCPHNPPGLDTSKEAFEAEYYLLYDQLEKLLDQCGENNAYGEGDFYLEPALVDSRGIGLEITNNMFISEKLLTDLQGLLLKEAPGWDIYLGSGQYDFGLFIGGESIWLYRTNQEVLPQLEHLILPQG